MLQMNFQKKKNSRLPSELNFRVRCITHSSSILGRRVNLKFKLQYQITCTCERRGQWRGRISHPQLLLCLSVHSLPRLLLLLLPLCLCGCDGGQLIPWFDQEFAGSYTQLIGGATSPTAIFQLGQRLARPGVPNPIGSTALVGCKRPHD